MEENKSIDPKVGPGKEGVLVLAYELMKAQNGVLHVGTRLLNQQPISALDLFLLLRAKRLQQITKEKPRMMQN